MDILDGLPDTTRESHPHNNNNNHRRRSQVGATRSTVLVVEGIHRQWDGDDGTDEEGEEGEEVVLKDDIVTKSTEDTPPEENNNDDEENGENLQPPPQTHRRHHHASTATPFQEQHHRATREMLITAMRGVCDSGTNKEEDKSHHIHPPNYQTNPLLAGEKSDDSGSNSANTSDSPSTTRSIKPQSRFVKVRLLARGTFGDAWLCVPRGCSTASSSDYVVAKILHLPNMRSKELRYAQSEIHCLKNTHHANIVKYVDSEVGKRELVIMMEFANAGDLRDHIKIRHTRRHYFTESEVMLLFIQVLMAVDHMHSHRMLHRDLKTANILLTTSGLIKVADFGFSHQYDDDVTNDVGKTFCGTPQYVAPEMLAGMRYSSSSEVWSLGVILYELFCLERPFHSNSIKGLVEQVSMNEARPIPKGYTEDARALVATLLSHDPAQRPSCIELLTTPYVHQHFTSLIQLVSDNPHISPSAKTQWLADADGVRARIGVMAPCCMRPPPPFTTGTYPNPAGLATLSRQQNIKSDVHYEGEVNKLAISNHPHNDTWKKRYLILRDGHMNLCENAVDLSKCQSLAVSALQSVAVIPSHVSHRKYVFAVHTVGGKCTWLQAPSEIERHNWILAIQTAMGVL